MVGPKMASGDAGDVVWGCVIGILAAIVVEDMIDR